MPNTASDLDVQIKESAGNTIDCADTRLIIQVTSLQTPENVLPLLLLVPFLPKLVTTLQKRRRKQTVQAG